MDHEADGAVIGHIDFAPSRSRGGGEGDVGTVGRIAHVMLQRHSGLTIGHDPVLHLCALPVQQATAAERAYSTVVGVCHHCDAAGPVLRQRRQQTVWSTVHLS